MEGEQPAEEGVCGGTDDEDDHARLEVALGLKESLTGFKEGVSGEAYQADSQEVAGL